MQRKKPVWTKKAKEWIFLEAPLQGPLHAVLWNPQVEIGAYLRAGGALPSALVYLGFQARSLLCRLPGPTACTCLQSSCRSQQLRAVLNRAREMRQQRGCQKIRHRGKVDECLYYWVWLLPLLVASCCLHEYTAWINQDSLRQERPGASANGCVVLIIEGITEPEGQIPSDMASAASCRNRVAFREQAKRFLFSTSVASSIYSSTLYLIWLFL